MVKTLHCHRRRYRFKILHTTWNSQKKKKKEVRGSDTAVFPEKATAAAFHPLFGEHVLGVGRQYQDIQLCKGI